MNLNNSSKNNTIKVKNKDKINNFFITKIENPKKIINIPNTTKNIILNRNELLQKQKIKEKENDTLKNNFIDFMSENTNYIDIEKLTEYFKTEEEKKKRKYDENLKKIEKRKMLLHDINLEINKILIENVKINDKDIEIFFDEKINGLKREIKLKQQELEMYHQVFGHTYKINYKLKNKLETEYKYQNFYNQQHEKYSIIKHTTLYKLKKQEQLLNGLNQYFEKFITSNEEIINEKSKQLNKAEFEILLIKNDIENIEKELKNLKKKIIDKELNIKNTEENYKNKKEDLSSSIKNYITYFIKMEDIYQVLDVKNVGQILKKYNLLKQDYNNKSYMIKILSLKIIELNNELKKKKVELKNIYKEIYEVKLSLMSKKGNDTEERIILKKSQIKLLVAQIYDVLKEKINIFTQCINNALSNISKIKISMRNASLICPFSLDNKFTKKFNFFLSEDNKSLNLDLEKEFDEKKMLKFIIILIKSLYKLIANININISYYLFIKIIEDNEKKIKAKEEMIKSSKDLLKYKNEIYYEDLKIFLLKSDLIHQFYEKELNYTISRLNEKRKIYMRTPREIFRKIYQEKSSKSSLNFDFSQKNKEIDYSEEISSLRESAPDLKNKKIKKEKIVINRNINVIPKEDFMKMYYTFYKNSLKNRESLNKTLPKINFSSLSSHRFNFINQFLNENVSDKLSQEKKKKTIEERIKEKSKIINEKIKQKELMDFINKMNKTQNKFKNNNISGIIETKDSGYENKDKDISIDQEKKDQQRKIYLMKKQLEESKKPKKYKLKSKETEMNIISERLDDLRALDLYFSKGNKTVLDSSTFNEYYFKIKKILEKANNKIKESTINNANKSGQQNEVKKIRKLSNKKISNKIIKRNNSDGFDVNNIKRLEESKTSKAFDIINKEKKRLSYFRLNFFNKTSNIFKNEDNKNNNNE